jgi:hypothetical protein
MYVDEGSMTLDMAKDGVELPEMDQAPDPDAGLYIKDRKGGVVKVGIPRDCLAFQTGEGLIFPLPLALYIPVDILSRWQLWR